MDEVVARAARDARVLEEAGWDGVVVENFNDVPFHPSTVGPETVAALTRVVVAVRAVTSVPVGVNVLRNDAAAALGIAIATGARFVRINVHTGSMWTDQGLLHGRAADTMRLRGALAPDVAVLADVHVKHAVPPAGSDLATAARDAWHRGLADALVVSGTATGAAPSTADLLAVKQAVPDACVLVGSGLDAESVVELLGAADGAIVGSALMEGARAGAAVDPERAAALARAARAAKGPTA
jgi:hypothetical protein